MHWRVVLAFTLCLGIWLRESFAEDLEVAVGEWPPYLSTDLKHDGVVAHMISDIFSDEGYRVKIRFLPWPRAYKDAAHGIKDATGVWMHKPEREQDFYYSDPILKEQFVFFHLSSFPFDWHSLKDLEGLAIGGGIKYSYGAEFDAALDSGLLTMERVLTEQQNFEKLIRKRIQIYPQELNVGYSVLRAHFTDAVIQQVTHHPKPLLNNLSYVLFPRASSKSQKLLAVFNKRLKMYRRTGKYDAYFEAFHRGAYEKTTP